MSVIALCLITDYTKGDETVCLSVTYVSSENLNDSSDNQPHGYITRLVHYTSAVMSLGVILKYLNYVAPVELSVDLKVKKKKKKLI